MRLPGTVYLVGAGPGDPRLITVRGLDCVRAADVLIHDRLVHPALLEEARPSAERIFAGKGPGRQVLRQGQINALMIQKARTGRTVTRLKGGDPFVFGRGGEEAEALAEARIPWEVVPGISSAIGVPARAAIPLTRRCVAANFAVVTAHRCGSGEGQDWGALARMDTLVVLMGVETLGQTTRSLLAHGREPGTPVAVIQEGTLIGERIVTGTLADIADRVKCSSVCPPAVIVVGAVAGMRSTLIRAADTSFQPSATTVKGPVK